MIAYYYHIRNREKKVKKWLDRSNAAAKKYGIIIMEQWISHTRKECSQSSLQHSELIISFTGLEQ